MNSKSPESRRSRHATERRSLETKPQVRTSRFIRKEMGALSLVLVALGIASFMFWSGRAATPPSDPQFISPQSVSPTLMSLDSQVRQQQIDYLSGARMAIEFSAKVVCQELKCDPIELASNSYLVDTEQFRKEYWNLDNCKNEDKRGQQIPPATMNVQTNKIYIDYKKVRKQASNPMGLIFALEMHEAYHRNPPFKGLDSKDVIQHQAPSEGEFKVVGKKGLYPVIHDVKNSVEGKRCILHGGGTDLVIEEAVVDRQVTTDLGKYGLSSINVAERIALINKYEKVIVKPYFRGDGSNLFKLQQSTDHDEYYGSIGKALSRGGGSQFSVPEISSGRQLVENNLAGMSVGPQ